MNKSPLTVGLQRNILSAIGVLFFVTQGMLFIYTFYESGKHFCWAPHNVQVKYQLRCTINDVVISNKEIFNRYGLNENGWEAHDEDNIKEIITAKERQNKKQEKVNVTYTYSVNGNAEETWTYAK